MLVVAGFTATAVHAAGASSREYQIKAAFLYTFIKFVEWPAEARGDEDAPFVIGIVGDDPFGAILDKTIKGKRIRNRDVVVKRIPTLSAGETPAGIHLIFISSSEEHRLATILASARGSSVLTVGDMERFAHRGGLIGFAVKGNRMRFEVNMKSVKQTRLKFSSELLSLAIIVED